MTNKEKFIIKANKKHNNKYDYSLVEYIHSQIKVKIICPEHGAFEMKPNTHTQKSGCPKCKSELIKKIKTKTTKQFIFDSKNIHGNKYDYSLVNYKGSHTKVKIVCPKHGIFEQKPNNHLNGQNCPKCINNNIKLTTKDFIKKAKEIHGNKYDYSLVNYKNNKTNIKIICDGKIYEQSPKSHLKGMNVKSLSKNDFIKKAKIIHNNKYDYSLVEFDNTTDYIKIICPEHGIFEQIINNHLRKKGCNKCAIDQKTLTTNEFIKNAVKLHKNKYDYSLASYVNAHKKIKIICPEHGIFNQTPNSHIIKKQGCPICNENKGEKEIRLFLIDKNIKYKQQKRFNKCKNKKCLPFDFYLPKYNICIEYDGEQHYKSIEYFGGENGFLYRQINDKIKNEYCNNNNIRLIRIRYDENITEKLNQIFSFF